MADGFFDQLADITRESLGRLQVSIKTNYTPEIPIDTDGGEPGIVSSLIGFRGGVIVRNSRGQVIETFGDPAATDPVRVTVAIVVLGLLSAVFVRGVLKR